MPGAHIVVANEDPALLERMVQDLRAADYCVFQAYDGLSAFELTLGLRYIDLLITDTRMPGFDGAELIRHVRDQLPAIPILYIQNQGQPAVAPDRLPQDVPTLKEVFDREQLLEAVRELLNRRLTYQ